jgi:hypothetical protein
MDGRIEISHRRHIYGFPCRNHINEGNPMPKQEKLYIATTRAILPEDAADGDDAKLELTVNFTDFCRQALRQFIAGDKKRKIKIDDKTYNRPLLKKYLVDSLSQHSLLYYALTEEHQDNKALVMTFYTREDLDEEVSLLMNDATKLMNAFNAFGTVEVSAVIEEKRV